MDRVVIRIDGFTDFLRHFVQQISNGVRVAGVENVPKGAGEGRAVRAPGLQPAPCHHIDTRLFDSSVNRFLLAGFA